MNRERIAELEADYLEDHPPGLVEPFVFDDPTNLESSQGRFPFPIITEPLLIDGWERTEKEWFVDSSGFGDDKEPALTVDQFRTELLAYVREHPDHGFGITGVGQFQVYVSAFRPE